MQFNIESGGLELQVNDSGICYFNRPKEKLFNNDWILDHDKIFNFKKYKLTIADFSSEHYGSHGLDHVYDAFEKQGINFLLLSHDPGDHFRRPNMIFFPHYYHSARHSFKTQDHPSLKHFQRQYPVSCQNHNCSRYFRVYNYLAIKNKHWFDSVFFSMHNRSLKKTRNDDHLLDADMIAQWNQIRRNFPVGFDSQSGQDGLVGLLEGNINSYINLVTESVMLDTIFVTEKTWRPVAAAQLFVIIGSKGTVDHLRNIGVDVFDDIIDHRHYDNNPDWQQRIHGAHQVLESLLSQDLEKIYQQTHHRRLKNVEKFYSGKFDLHGSLEYITQCINTLN
jgi:hypothetical protein